MTKKEKLYELWRVNKNLNVKKEADKIGLDRRQAFRYVAGFKKGNQPGARTGNHGNSVREEINREFSSNAGIVEVFSLNIRTLDDALKVAEVDLEKWEVDRYVINSWQVTMKLDQGDGTQEPETRTNFQVKIWLKSKTSEPLRVAIETLIKEIPAYKVPPALKSIKRESGIAAELALLDAHFGKFAWAMETGRRDYDLKIATEDYLMACKKVLNYVAPFKPEKIIYIVGQDLMHVENYAGQTPKGGNPLDRDSRLPKIFRTAMEATTKAIYWCRTVAPVEVLWIPGNHDMHVSMFLCYVLKEHFRNDKHIEVDVSPSWRKARLWGNLLVGWTHEIVNRHESWANELAQNWPELWGQSKWREWHFGHKHKKREIKTHPVMTHGGVLMRQLTALSPIDAWHFEYLFTDAVPGGESFIWTKDSGVISNYVAWTKPKEGEK